MMKKILLSALAALFPVLAAAQPSGKLVEIPLAIDYDLDATTFVYPGFSPDLGGNSRLVRAGDFPGIPGNGKVQTVGSATTITSLNGQDPFAAFVAGDQITVTTVGNRKPDASNATEGGQTVTLSVLTVPDADTITVNQSVDLTGGVSFFWKKFFVGGQIGRGWIAVRTFEATRFTVLPATLTTDTAGMHFRVECRHDTPGVDTGSFTIVYPSEGAFDGAAFTPACAGSAVFAPADQSCLISDADVTAAIGSATAMIDTRGFFECRVGIRISVADDGADAVPESIRIFATGYPAR